jgi:hypothetical protein
MLALLCGNAAAAGGGFMVGGGAEGDSEDAQGFALMASIGITEKSWLSASLAKSSVDLPRGLELDSQYGDIEIDHWFEPVGVRLGAAYWGDSDFLNSSDWRAALYWRNDNSTIAAEYEFRDFELTTPGNDVFPSRRIMFDADGFGASMRFSIGERLSLRIAGMKYNYSAPFRPIENTDVIDLLSVSRLSLMNSLVDHRASITLGLDQGLRRWELDIATREGVLTGDRTNSLTLRYLLPLARFADIEFGLGYDDSQHFGGATFLSVFLYFYGGT